MKGLKETRYEKGLSRKQVETMTGVTYANLSLIERGVSIPDLKTREKLEAFFDTTINWLDTENIDSEPREFPVTWNQAEREFRYFLHMISALPPEERKAFIQSICKHLNKLKK
jgi:transcriptional regulator with XRE-family HTH domain